VITAVCEHPAKQRTKMRPACSLIDSDGVRSSCAGQRATQPSPLGLPSSAAAISAADNVRSARVLAVRICHPTSPAGRRWTRIAPAVSCLCVEPRTLRTASGNGTLDARNHFGALHDLAPSTPVDRFRRKQHQRVAVVVEEVAGRGIERDF
jgi:hypothetical protein